MSNVQNEVSLKLDVLTTLPELEAFRAQWELLFRASDASPYLCYEWMHAWWRHQPTGDGVYVCVASDDAGPLAILPLVAWRGRFATRLELFGGGPATRNTAIVAERAQKLPILAAACDCLGRFHLRWDYCVADKIPAGSALLVAEQRPDDASGPARTSLTSEGRTAVIELAESWDEFSRGLSRNHRKNLARRHRQLEQRGVLRQVRAGLDPADDPRELERLLADALCVARRSWQGSADEGHAVSDPDQVEFVREVSRALARRGMLDLSVLYAGQRPVSFSWGAARRPYLSSAAAGFDLAEKSAAPGHVHLRQLVEDSIERGFTRLDLGHEFAERWQSWTESGDELFRVTHYARPRLSRLRQRLQERWEDSVTGRLRRWLG
jgi:CelD/BcsL family acetyltransferase involved in cellulose biosynthesis